MTNHPEDHTHSELDHPRQPLYADNPDGPVAASESDISGHPQPEPPATEQIATQPYESPRITEHRGTIYAWQMEMDHGWDIIGMRLPNGTTLPMVTTHMDIAWSMFEIAQAHANANGVQCRLHAWDKSAVVAIVDPEVER